MKQLFLILTLVFISCSTGDQSEHDITENTGPRVVNVYSHRHYDTDKQLLALFTERTGIRVNMVQAGDDELMARLEAEGSKSPCDVFITADAGRLGLARSRGLLQPMISEVLQANIPAQYRDPDGYWFGLTMRARVIAYNKQKIDPESIDEYTDLTKPEWHGRVLVRSSENIYNQSLMAAMIEHQGTATAETWAKGIVMNMARHPQGGDTDQLLALAEGIGDVAIANSYYVGKLMADTDPKTQRARDVIGISFPSIDDHGTHVNISGGGVARYAPHPQEAIALLEFLSGEEAQLLFAEGNKEYPVKQGVTIPTELAAFGDLNADTLNLAALARNNAQAVKLLGSAGWR